MHAGHGQGARRSSPPLSTEPAPRAWQFSSTVAGQTYIYGGTTRGAEDDEKSVFGFLQKKEVWKRHTTTGTPPQGSLRVGACTSVGDVIYMYGDYNSRSEVQGGLYSLDVREMKWSKVSNGPRLGGCGIAHRKNKLVVFGGYGDSGRSNELHIFDLEEGEECACVVCRSIEHNASIIGSWSSPEVTGTRPPPCEDFTFTMVDDRRVLLFGGNLGIRRGASGDAYILDMEKMHWSKLEYPEGEPCPAGRCEHAAVCLGQGTRPQLVVHGGHDDYDVLNDVLWILDVESGRWKEIKHPNLSWRYEHSATAISLSEGLTEVTLFGGWDGKEMLSDTTVLRFEQNRTTGEWELVDVGENRHIGTAERLKKKEERIAHHAFLGNIEKHMEKSGSIKRQIANLVFVGLPGSGKTTLIANLLKLCDIEKMIVASPSTNIMDGVLTVDISADVSTFKAADVDECGWNKVEYSISCLRQMGIACLPTVKTLTEAPVDNLHPPVPERHEEPSQPDHSPGIRQRDSYSEPVVAIQARKSTSSEKVQNLPEKQSVQPLQRQKLVNVLDIVDKLLKENNLQDILLFLQNKTSLYLSDTGGQIEFQELLALLVSPRSIFFFVFSLVKGLNKKVEVSFRVRAGEGVRHTNCYTSSLTGRESFLQTMSSIDSMESLADDSSSSQQKPYVFVVGTHRDVLEEELGQEGAEARIAELNEELISLVREHKYDDLVVMANQGKGHLMFTVDNTRQGDQVFSLIRSQVKHFIESREEFNVKFPLSFLLASLELQQSKEPFVDRKSFTRAVVRYGIPEEDVDHLIQFLQSRIGLIRYFPIPGLENVLMRDPQFLYNLVSYLLIQSFLAEATLVSEHSEIQKGIYCLEYLERCISKFNLGSGLVTLEMVILLLKELRIMAPFYDQESKSDKFFVPCVLNHLKDSLAFTESSVVQPLAVKFKCGHCPKGMFGVLVHCLLTHDKSDKTTEWVLDKSLIFRDQVSFKVGCYRDVVTLKSSSTHLEVSCHPTCQPERKEMSALKVICHKVRTAVLSGVVQATVTLHYDTEKTRHSLALVCSNEECAKLHDIEDDHEYFNCYGQLCSLPDSGAYWFADVPVYSFPGLKEGAELSPTEGSEFEVQFAVTQDPPLLKGRKNILWKDDVAVSDDRVSIGESVICFSNVQRADAGRYTITSYNGIGQGHGTFNLTVAVPPEYELEDDYVVAQAGKSPILHFSVTSDPPLTKNTRHVVTAEKGGKVLRFKVQDNCITFRNVKTTDTGSYTIRCRNAKGLEGKATFELDISESPCPPVPRPPSQHGDITAESLALGIEDYPLTWLSITQLKWRDPQQSLSDISTKWFEIGTLLSINREQLKMWEVEYQGDLIKCLESVITFWQQHGGSQRYPATWQGFLALLRCAECAAAADNVTTALLDRPSSLSVSLSRAYEGMRYEDVYFFGEPIRKHITSSGGQVGHLEEIGISLVFPEGALQPSEKPLEIVIHPAIGCPLQLPEGYAPASPVYFIEHMGSVTFLKNIDVHIQHWVKLTSDSDCKDMGIFTSKSAPFYDEGRPVYRFSKLQGRAVFSPHNSVGRIELSHFCALTVGSASKADCRCSVRFYQNISPAPSAREKLAVICICLEQGLICEYCDKAVSKGYTGFVAKLEGRSTQSGMFESDSVTIQVKKGWEVSFDKHPAKISKSDVHIYDLVQTTKKAFRLKIRDYPDYPPKLSVDKLSNLVPSETAASFDLLGLNEACSFTLQAYQSSSTQDFPPRGEHPLSPSPWSREVNPSYLDIIKYKNSTTGTSGQIRILSELAPQWKTIANRLGLSSAVILTIECPGMGKDFYTCLMEAFEHWRQNSSQLPNHSLFPNTWRGIYNLLQESDYGNLAGKLEIALKADISNILGNYTEETAAPTYPPGQSLTAAVPQIQKESNTTPGLELGRRKMNAEAVAAWLQNEGIDADDMEILKSHKVNERRFLKLTVSSVELKDVSQAFKDDLEDLQRDMESQTRGFQQTQS